MNSKVSKRFKKKMKNFRQGMTGWRVHGWPIEEHNYRDWGSNQEELDRQNGKGNAMCFKYDGQWFFIHCENKCNIPKKTVWGWIDWYGGKRKTHLFKSFASMYGSYGNRVFKNQFQAQAYMLEVATGKHPSVLNESRYFQSEMDRLDNILDDMRIGDGDMYGDGSELEFA